MTAVFVCSLKDIVCGEIPANWCDNCPRKHVMVPVAPHAAAGPYPTAMRQATTQEHEWLMAGVRRAGTLVPHPDTADAEEMRFYRAWGYPFTDHSTMFRDDHEGLCAITLPTALPSPGSEGTVSGVVLRAFTNEKLYAKARAHIARIQQEAARRWPEAYGSIAQSGDGSPARQGARPDGQDLNPVSVKDLSASASPATKEQQ